MKKILITCHVEPLKKGKSIKYLDDFFQEIGNLGTSVKFLLMYGTDIKDVILKKYSYTNYGLHIHDGKTEEGIKAYFKLFKKYPADISFGHWVYTAEDFKILKKYNIKNDYSYSGYRNNIKYFIRKPFTLYGVNVFPVSCNPKHPINPLTNWYDFFLGLLLLLLSGISHNGDLHVSFHSYDLYSGKLTRFRWYVFVHMVKILNGKK